MSALQKAETMPQAAPQVASMDEAIIRAASDPSVDIDKLDRLMQMRERMQQRQAEVDFASALADMQTELPSIGERGNAANRYTFALWEDINAAIKPVLSRFGFALSFRTDFADGIAVTGVLSHRSGHAERTTIKLPADNSGNKPAVQAVASSVSYGKRYTAGALLNLTSHGEDDDAFAASGQPVDDKEQAKRAEWLEAIKGASDADALSKVKSDCCKSYGMPDQVPKALQDAFRSRTRELKA